MFKLFYYFLSQKCPGSHLWRFAAFIMCGNKLNPLTKSGNINLDLLFSDVLQIIGTTNNNDNT